MKRSEIKRIIPEITAEQLDEIMGINGSDIEAAKEKFADYVSKADHDKAVAELTALKEAAAKQPQPQDYSKELAELENLRKFKTDTDAKELGGKQDAYILKQLEAANVHPNSVKLLLKQFDKGAMEWTDKGDFKDFDKALEAVKGEFPDHFGVKQIVGVKPGKAAAGGGGKDNILNLEQAVAAELNLIKGT